MLLFSWERIHRHSGGLPREIIRIVRMLTYKDIPWGKQDKLYNYSQLNFSGECFLVHPEKLLYNAYKYTAKDISIYIALAALRSLPDYRAYGTLTLDLLHAPTDVIGYLDKPNLLSIKDGRIHFLYEEAQN
jgi:hypothetical protein